MINEREPLVHISMFSPDRQGAEEFDGLMNRLGGPATGEIRHGVAEKVFSRFTVPKELKDRFNTHFYHAVSDHFGLPEEENVKYFWIAQENQANSVQAYLSRLFPGAGISLLTELNNPIGNVADTVATLMEEGHDSRPGHERKRRTLLALISTGIQADNAGMELGTELEAINNVLTPKLFTNKDNTDPHKIHAYHDPVTNTVVGLQGQSGIPEGAVHKIHSREVRKIRRAGKVIYETRVKPLDSAIAKAIHRAGENGGYVKAEKDVLDRFGAIIAMVDSKLPPQQLDAMVAGVLNKRYRPIVTPPEPDHATDGYRDDTKGRGGPSENRLGWHRVKLDFEGVPVPFEFVIFPNAKSYLDYYLEIGQKDPETGIFNGNGRPIYELDRATGLLALSRPREIYTVNPRLIVTDRIEEVAADLRREGEIRERKVLTEDKWHHSQTTRSLVDA